MSVMAARNPRATSGRTQFRDLVVQRKDEIGLGYERLAARCIDPESGEQTVKGSWLHRLVTGENIEPPSYEMLRGMAAGLDVLVGVVRPVKGPDSVLSIREQRWQEVRDPGPVAFDAAVHGVFGVAGVPHLPGGADPGGQDISGLRLPVGHPELVGGEGAFDGGQVAVDGLGVGGGGNTVVAGEDGDVLNAEDVGEAEELGEAGHADGAVLDRFDPLGGLVHEACDDGAGFPGALAGALHALAERERGGGRVGGSIGWHGLAPSLYSFVTVRVWGGTFFVGGHACFTGLLDTLSLCPPNPSASTGVRSSAAVNAEIRALMVRSGGYLRAEDRPVYEALREEWAEAVRAEVVEAA